MDASILQSCESPGLACVSIVVAFACRLTDVCQPEIVLLLLASMATGVFTKWCQAALNR